MRPQPPIELNGSASRLADDPPPLGAELVDSLRTVGEVITDQNDTANASRDWWPLALHWALQGEVPRRAAAVVRPTSVDGVAHVLRTCSGQGVAVTAAGGRSGVVGGTVPLAGGVILDLTELAGVESVDAASGLVAVRPGTFGPDLEHELREHHGLTVGHYPQSFDLATVGGWVAARGAGQYSTRYGKIEHIVAGLEVVLADGSIVTTGGAPAAATGPDLTQLFVGSEGTLGVITKVWLRAWPTPAFEQRAAFTFDDLSQGFDACRQILRRGATPAVLRLYDAIESARGHGGDGQRCTLLVLDEGDPVIVDATMRVVAESCAAHGAAQTGTAPVDAWMEHRNDTSALQALTRKGFVVDTLEIAAPWSALNDVFHATTTAMLAVPHARAASCHLSHSYVDGACLYFTFAATPPADEVDRTYVALWDAGQRAVLASGGNLSHHHGVGLVRDRFMTDALGGGMDVFAAVKRALDPAGILNPGKLGLGGAPDVARWPV